MNPYLKTSLLIGLASLGVVTASHAHQAAPAFNPGMLDTDRDGIVSASEQDTHADLLFARADQDRNGQLSRDERRALHAFLQGAVNGRPPVDHGDGHETAVISKAQFREGFRGHAVALDADRDGRLTVAELNTATQHGSSH